MSASPSLVVWRLYGTLGCHLCDEADQLLNQLKDARPIAWQSVDIADLSIEQQNQLALKIPVLDAGHTQLFWPFSLTDLMRL